MNDILSNLRVTTWYKAVLAVSITAFLIVLAAQRNALTIFLGGAVLVGLGEWKNHPKMEVQYRPTTVGSVAMIKDVSRRWTLVGSVLQLIGLALLAYGTLLLLGVSLPQLN